MPFSNRKHPQNNLKLHHTVKKHFFQLHTATHFLKIYIFFIEQRFNFSSYLTGFKPSTSQTRGRHCSNKKHCPKQTHTSAKKTHCFCPNSNSVHMCSLISWLMSPDRLTYCTGVISHRQTNSQGLAALFTLLFPF